MKFTLLFATLGLAAGCHLNSEKSGQVAPKEDAQSNGPVFEGQLMASTSPTPTQTTSTTTSSPMPAPSPTAFSASDPVIQGYWSWLLTQGYPAPSGMDPSLTTRQLVQITTPDTTPSPMNPNGDLGNELEWGPATP